MNIVLRGALFEGVDSSPGAAEHLKTLGYSDDEISEAFFVAVKAQTLALRAKAYSGESDPLFLEAIRKDAAGDVAGAEAARAEALKVVEAIKARFPLPTE
jgi:hypothetical protein